MADETQVVLEFVPDTSKLNLDEIAKGINDELSKVGKGNADFLKGVAQGIAEETKEIEKLSKSVQGLTKSEQAANKEIDKFAKSMNDLSKGIAGGAIKQGTDNIQKIGNAATKTANEATKLTTQLRAMREQLGRLDEGSAEFQKLSIEAAKLEDRIGDVSRRIRTLSSDTFAIDAVVDSARAIAGAFSIAQGAAALFGDENKDLQKALLKVQASLAILNGLQETSNFLTGQSAGKLAIVSAAQKIYAFVTNAATFATKAFNLALVGLGAGAVIAGVIALITYWEEIKTAIFGANEELETYEQTLDDVIAKNNQAIDRIKSGLDVSQISARELNSQISRLKEQLEDIPREGLELIVNGQVIKQNVDEARRVLEAEIKRLEDELLKRLATFKRDAGAEVTGLDTIDAEQLPELPIRIKPVLTQETIDEINAFEDKIEQERLQREQERQQLIRETIIAGTRETLDAVFSIESEARNRRLGEEIDALNRRREAELSNKELTEQQRAQIDAKYRQQERQLRIKAFNAEKQAKISQAIINGALAITTILATVPPVIPGTIIPNPQYFASLALAGVATALQVATITAQKPPAFKKGTKGAPGGMALVGEEGAELMHVPRGAKIVPHSETMKVLSGHPDTDEILSRFNIPVTSAKVDGLKKDFSGYDFTRLEKLIAKGSNKMPQVHVDKNGVVTLVNEANSKRTYLGERYSSR